MLSHFGVFDRLKAQAVRLEGANVRRYSDNEIINSTSFASLEKEFGAPTYVVHRADLHQALLDRALELGATLQTNVSSYGLGSCPSSQTNSDSQQAHVENVDFDKTLLKLRGQPALSHDLIIAADGIKSGIRSQMMARRGEVDETIPTGEAAYRKLCSWSYRLASPLVGLTKRSSSLFQASSCPAPTWSRIRN